jgi:hypothetical protein
MRDFGQCMLQFLNLQLLFRDLRNGLLTVHIRLHKLIAQRPVLYPKVTGCAFNLLHTFERFAVNAEIESLVLTSQVF